MSLAVISSVALQGLASIAVRVEVHLSTGLPAFSVVGSADARVKESRERVRSAIACSGFNFPSGRVTVNL
ncbi:MAG: magnesium chelatase domain-containing protein, partial [Burkholderiaceae bacterium]